MIWRFDRARKLMDRDGRKTSWVAAQAGLTPATLRQYLQGNAKPGTAALKLMAATLNTTPEYLKGESDDPNPRFEKSG